ncbi:MAG: hypothetical protein JWQ44_1850 [Chthoniobacter sp.]|nr:hypothetical protein [Chthoniobacter sp.]
MNERQVKDSINTYSSGKARDVASTEGPPCQALWWWIPLLILLLGVGSTARADENWINLELRLDPGRAGHSFSLLVGSSGSLQQGGLIELPSGESHTLLPVGISPNESFTLVDHTAGETLALPLTAPGRVFRIPKQAPPNLFIADTFSWVQSARITRSCSLGAMLREGATGLPWHLRLVERCPTAPEVHGMSLWRLGIGPQPSRSSI